MVDMTSVMRQNGCFLLNEVPEGVSQLLKSSDGDIDLAWFETGTKWHNFYSPADCESGCDAGHNWKVWCPVQWAFKMQKMKTIRFLLWKVAKGEWFIVKIEILHFCGWNKDIEWVGIRQYWKIIAKEEIKSWNREY